MDNRVTIDRLKQMEVTVYEKVRQKTYVKKDEGDKAKGAFKFFDMEDKGIVDFKRFVQTLERLNCNFTEKEMKVLYQKHAGSDGILTFDEMCGLLFDMGSGVKDNSNPIFETSKGINGMITSQGMSKRLS